MDKLMIISILQGKRNELYITPEAVSVLVQQRHSVLVEGNSSDKKCLPYLNVGAYIINTKQELLDRGILIIKADSPTLEEIAYVSGEEKIFFTAIPQDSHEAVKAILKNPHIIIINYNELRRIKNKEIDPRDKTEFSNYALPFLISLADKGIKSLVNDEVLRQALCIMHGKVYNETLAKFYNLPCEEF